MREAPTRVLGAIAQVQMARARADIARINALTAVVERMKDEPDGLDRPGPP